MDVLPTREIRVKRWTDPVRIHATGDWHVGEAGCSEARLRRVLADAAKDPSALFFLMGDLGGFIAPDDRRWEPEAVAEGLTIRDLADWGGALVTRICDVAAPIRGRVIGSLTGNHEVTYSRRKSCDVAHQIATGLGCPSLGYAAFLTVRISCGNKSRDVSVYATHGSGGAATPGGKMARLVRMMSSFDADLIMMGHVHECHTYQRSRLYQDGGEIGAKIQTGVVTGTYLETYTRGVSGYGERCGYAPTVLGHPVISITPSTGRVAVEWAGDVDAE